MKMKKITASLLLFSLLAGCLFAAVGCGKDDNTDTPVTYDYLTEDLTPYISVDPSVWASISLTLKLDEVTDADVDEAINNLLVYYKNKTAANGGAGVTDQPISLGDMVYIYYRGDTLQNGVKNFFTGGSNIEGAKPAEIEIGSMSFVSGFESSLIGLIPEDMVKMKPSGTLEDGDYVTVYMEAVYPNGDVRYSYESILFSEENRATVDATYGEGFYENMVGMTYNLSTKEDDIRAATSSVTLPYNGERGEGEVSYTMRFCYVTDRKDEPTKVTAYFPADYREPTLQGKEVFFDVYLDSTKNYVIQYVTPELNDDFILKTMELTEAELAEYKGDTLVEKFRSKVTETLEEQYRETYDSLFEGAMISYLTGAATYAALPDKALQAARDEYNRQLDEAFENIGAYYGYTDKEAFAKSYFGYTEGSFAQYAETNATDTVKKRLAFYYIGRMAGLIPDGETLNTAVEEMKQEYFRLNLEQNKDEFDRENFASDESYQKAIDAFYQEMLDHYGEEFFLENVRYEAIMKGLKEHTTVEQLGRKKA